MKRLVLIDGNAILHRAYHALPPLTAPDGALVNAVYGFTSMLLKIVNDLKPSHLAVAFDRPAPTFRKKLYQKYQAKRPKMDEELVGQIDAVHKVLGAFRISIFEVDGFEADDIIGTITKQTTSDIPGEDIDQVIIVTGDRDLLQLVEDERVYVYMPTRGLSEAKLYDEKEVKQRLGVVPKQIPDFKALAGDASDNYPGVPGVGPKTAAQLLVQFGSIANLRKALKSKQRAHLSETLVQKLAQGADSATLSYQLATIRTDVPLALALEKMKIESLDQPAARQALAELNFQSLLKRLVAPETNRNKKRAAAKKGQAEKEKPKGEQQPLF